MGAGARSYSDFGCSQILYTPHQTCGSGLARDGGVSGNIDVGCAGLIASKPQAGARSYSDFGCSQILYTPHQTCGSGLARDGGVSEQTSMLAVLASSRASRKRALAPTVILVVHRFYIHHIKPVGAGSPAMAVCGQRKWSVSYTHLTLPTNREV